MRGPDRWPERLAGVAVEAGRDVDGENAACGRFDSRRDLVVGRFERAAQAGAEQGIDDPGRRLNISDQLVAVALVLTPDSRGKPNRTGWPRRSRMSFLAASCAAWVRPRASLHCRPFVGCGTRHRRRSANRGLSRCRAITKPSPPLLPGPHRITVGFCSGFSRISNSAQPRPAFSISTMPGTPNPSIARRSSSRTCRESEGVTTSAMLATALASGASVSARPAGRGPATPPPPRPS